MFLSLTFFQCHRKIAIIFRATIVSGFTYTQPEYFIYSSVDKI